MWVCHCRAVTDTASVNQYDADAKMCENWGYERLDARFREESIGEMNDADVIVARTLYLEGILNLRRRGTVRVGETVPEKLQLAIDLGEARLTV